MLFFMGASSKGSPTAKKYIAVDEKEAKKSEGEIRNKIGRQ